MRPISRMEYSSSQKSETGILLNILDIVTKLASVRRLQEPFLRKTLKTFITEHICLRSCGALIALIAHQQFYLVFSVIMHRSETDHLGTHQLFYAKHPYFSTGTPVVSEFWGTFPLRYMFRGLEQQRLGMHFDHGRCINHQIFSFASTSPGNALKLTLKRLLCS